MKPTIYNRFIALIIAGLLAACSAATKEDDKAARLEKLKGEHTDMAAEIKKLEAEVAAENPDTAANASLKAKEVTVTEATPRKFDHYVQTQGRVESENNVLVSAKAPGSVTALYANEGDDVKKGQVIAQIDNSIIVRSIEGMKSQLDLARSVYERQKNLWDQKIGTEVQFLQAKTQKESLEKQIASLEEQNDQTRIKSPINGTVDEIFIKVGENVGPGSPGVRVVNAADLKIQASASEAYVTRIKKGNKVIVLIPEVNKEIEARVTFVGKTIDPLSRTFVVEVKLPSHPDLRPNMTGVIKVVYFTAPDAIAVPVNVVQTVNGEKVLFVAESDGKNTVARRRVVTVEGVFDNMAQIKSGVSAGEKVITFGYQGLSDGEVIKI